LSLSPFCSSTNLRQRQSPSVAGSFEFSLTRISMTFHSECGVVPPSWNNSSLPDGGRRALSSGPSPPFFPLSQIAPLLLSLFYQLFFPPGLTTNKKYFLPMNLIPPQSVRPTRIPLWFPCFRSPQPAFPRMKERFFDNSVSLPHSNACRGAFSKMISLPRAQWALISHQSPPPWSLSQ